MRQYWIFLVFIVWDCGQMALGVIEKDSDLIQKGIENLILDIVWWAGMLWLTGELFTDKKQR